MKFNNMVVKTREPILRLRMGSGYSDDYDYIEIYYSDIKNAKLGKIWRTRETHIIRDAMEQSARIIYKDDEGAVILLKTNLYDDSDEPEMETRYDLIYVPFKGDGNDDWKIKGC